MIKNQNNRTKIIATVGPASNSYDTLLELVKEGVDVFRFNFSHGTHEQHRKAMDYIHKLNRVYKLNIGILADLQGPKIRIGEVKGGSIELVTDQEVKLTTKESPTTAKSIYVNYELLAKEAKPGNKIMIDDGKLELEVLKTNKKDSLTAVVRQGGPLSSRKGVNLPNMNLSIPSITEKDKADLKFALENRANWIALSFVRSAEEILELRQMMGGGRKARIISKIEKPEAVAAIDEIIMVSDAVMIARGDLGVEVPLEQMPLIQKSIVKKCILASKPVVVATQIMESMIDSARPTRAEINDVANDMIDGADALMLSGETSVGKHPVKVVQTLEKIMSYIEGAEVVYNKNIPPTTQSKTFLSDSVCHSAARLAEAIDAKAILGMTKSGYTAFMVSSYRPKAKIYIFTNNEDLLNILSICWGVHAFYYDQFTSTDDTIADCLEILKSQGLVASGDTAVNIGSMPIQEKQRTNMLKVTVVE